MSHTPRTTPARVREPVNASPTPYPALNIVLRHFAEGVRALLGPNFIGAYLQGSFALGDFDEKSDVDFVIAIARDIDNADVRALNALHTAIHDFPPPWGHRLEGSYFPAAVLRRLGDPPCGPSATPSTAYPLLYLDHGARTLARSDHCNSRVVRWVTREKGIVLAGPPPRALIDEVTPAALRAEMRDTMHRAATLWLGDPALFNTLWVQAFAVGLFCRTLHTLKTGVVTSKKAAAAWALSTLDARWHALIAESLSARPSASLGPADPAAVAETLAFIRYALEWMARGGKVGGSS